MKMRFQQLVIILGIFIVLSLACRFQAEEPPAIHPAWTSFPKVTNLRAMACDHEGRSWLGGHGGVMRWDPVTGEFVVFDREDGLADDVVNDIAIAPDGTLWVATYGGASHFDGTSWTSYTSEDGLETDLVKAVAIDSQGVVWFSSTRGVTRFDGSEWASFTDYGIDEIPSGEVLSIAIGANDDVWIGIGLRGGGAAVAHYDGHTWQAFGEGHGRLRGAHPTMELPLAVTPNGVLWVGTNQGLSSFDGVSWVDHTITDDASDESIASLSFAPDGTLWAGGNMGVAHFDGGEWVIYEGEDNMPGMGVEVIAIAPNGMIWAADFPGHLFRYDGETWNTYGGPFTGHILAVTATDGTLWFGNYCPFNGGVSRYDGETWRCFSTDDGLVDDEILSIAPGLEGDIWVGTPGGLSHFDGVTWLNFGPPERLLAPILVPECSQIAAIVVASDGTIWSALYCHAIVPVIVLPIPVGGIGGGVLHFDDDTWTPYSVNDGLADNHVLSIFEDREGVLWFGTHEGVSRYDGECWTTYTVVDVLAGNAVLSIEQASDGSLWFGTNGGVSRFDGGSWTNYTTEDGLTGNAIYDIVQTSDADLWFATVDGISRFDGENWITYTTADGLVADYVQSITIDHDGNLWFGTISGVSRFDPGK